jgi:hypothetical protein
VSGVTPHRSSQVTYASPNEPSGHRASLSMSIVLELTRGRSLRILRPSGLSSIMSLKRGRTGPAVVSPKAATMSEWKALARPFTSMMCTYRLCEGRPEPSLRNPQRGMHSRSCSAEYGHRMLDDGSTIAHIWVEGGAFILGHVITIR